MSWIVYIKNGVGFTFRNRYKAYLKAKELGVGNFISVYNNITTDNPLVKHKVYFSIKELEKDIIKNKVK